MTMWTLLGFVVGLIVGIVLGLFAYVIVDTVRSEDK